MTQVQMSTLLGISIRTLQAWKHKKNREKLYVLLEQLDYHEAQELLQQKDHKHLIALLENQEHFTSYRDFEAVLLSSPGDFLQYPQWQKPRNCTALQMPAKYSDSCGRYQSWKKKP